MILSFLRVTAGILAVILLIGFLVLPVRGIQAEEQEIIVREDAQLLKQAGQSITAGLGAAVCMAAVFVIVWKQRDL